jgi:hypothetical protein
MHTQRVIMSAQDQWQPLTTIIKVANQISVLYKHKNSNKNHDASLKGSI